MDRPTPGPSPNVPDADPADRCFEQWLDDRRPEDLARVFDLLAPRLLLLASHVLGGSGDAEDALQATFLRVIEVAPTRFERGRPVLPWITGVLVREARKLRERNLRRPDPTRLGEPVGPLEPDAIAIDQEVRDALERGIAELPAPYAEVLTLRLIHGLTPTAIAHALRMSPETVKTRLRRGGERLRSKLPAGLASAVVAALTLGGRQLSAIRDVVLAGAAGVGAAATGGGAGAAASGAGATVAGGGVAALGSQALRWVAGIAAGTAIAAGTWVALDSEPEVPLREPAPRVVETATDDPTPVRQAVPGTIKEEDEPVVEPAPPRGLLSFEGQLVDDRYRDLEGVRVRAIRLHPTLFAAPLELLPVPRSEVEWVVAESMTDATGRFLLEGVPPFGALLFRFDPPEAPPWIELLGERPAPGDRVDLGTRQLPRTRFARGRILDPRGRGIEGAVLRRVSGGDDFRAATRFGLAGRALDAWLASRWQDPRAVALGIGGGQLMVADVPPWLTALADVLDPTVSTTGPDGGFVWASRSGSRVEVEVDAAGFAPQVIALTPADPVFDHDPFTVQPVPEVEIDVLDVQGHPVPAGFEVVVGRPSDGAAALRPLGETGPDGRLFAPVSRSGRQWFAVRGPGHPWHAVELEPRTPFVIRLPARHSLELRVKDLAGLALPGVRLRLLPGIRALALHQLGALAEFDLNDRLEVVDDGLVRVRDLPAGPWTALVAADEHLARVADLDVRGRLRSDVILTAGGATALQVAGEAFEALADREVLTRPLTDPDAALLLPAVVGRTDAKGRLEVSRFRHAEIGLAIGDVEAGWRQTVVRGAQDETRLVVRQPGTLEGALVDQDGPRFGTDSWVRATPDPLLVTRRAYAPLPVVVAAEPDAVFVMPRMEAGTWIVEEIPRPGDVRDLRSLLAVLFGDLDDAPDAVATLQDGERISVRLTQRFVIPVDQPEPEPRLHGSVAVNGLNAIQYVLLQGDGLEIPLTAAGRFDLGPNVGAREFTLVSQIREARQNVYWEGIVPPSVDGARIDLRTSAWSATLRSATGEIAEGVWVALDGEVAAGQSFGTQGSPRARFRLRSVARGFAQFLEVTHGTYRLRMRHPDHGWLELDEVEVGPDSVTIGQSLALRAPLRATGVVDFASLAPEAVAGSELVWSAIPGEDGITFERTGITDDAGNVTTSGLLPGRYRMELRVAKRFRRPDGQVVYLSPDVTREVVPLADAELVPGRVEGLRFARRR